jgi:hypothetical protein
MSTGAPTLERIATAGSPYAHAVAPQQSGPSVTVLDVNDVLPEEPEQPMVWRQVDELLKGLGASQARSAPLPDKRIRIGTSAHDVQWRQVATGVIVSTEEYEQRFRGLTLDAFRKAMSPELFEAYVRFVGVIPGRRHLDIVDIAALPDD